VYVSAQIFASRWSLLVSPAAKWKSVGCGLDATSPRTPPHAAQHHVLVTRSVTLGTIRSQHVCLSLNILCSEIFWGCGVGGEGVLWRNCGTFLPRGRGRHTKKIQYTIRTSSTTKSLYPLKDTSFSFDGERSPCLCASFRTSEPSDQFLWNSVWTTCQLHTSQFTKYLITWTYKLVTWERHLIV
jgi:hypothetical protein